MNLAILGTRGIPASYGGFETFAEELSTRLARRGHRVTVYCRSHGVANRPDGDVYRGVRLVFLPTIRQKYLDTVVHTFISVFHVASRDEQAVLICNAANSLFAWIPRVAGQRTLVNVDGLERKRRKWNALGRAWYAMSEWLSTFLPTAIVTDARTIQNYYRERFGKASSFIPYGASAPGTSGTTEIEKLGLRPRGYALYVSRLEPENNALLVVRGFEKTRTKMQLAVVGDAPYARDYIAEVRRTSDPRIVFTGAIYGEAYRELLANALCYIHATEVGGTHPALIEAMAAGCAVLYLETPENREVAGEVGLSFPHDEKALAAAIDLLLGDEPRRQDMGAAAAARARKFYDWERVTDQYEQLFAEMLKR